MVFNLHLQDDLPLSQVFICGIGIVYFIAFFSLWREVLALYGKEGLAPISESISRLKRVNYPKWKAPTLFWWECRDSFIQTLAILGMVASVFLFFDVFSPFMLFMLWCLYLSFVTVGSPFMNFQWDYLLLEAGFYAFILSLSSFFEAPMMIVLIALFMRMMFSSGISKLRAYTPHWRQMRAMDYHYESQPLPNFFAFIMHQQPRWLSTFSLIATLMIECLGPLLIFMGPEGRVSAFILFLVFQWLLMLTGNFTFFNILAIVLSIPLLFAHLPPSHELMWGVSFILVFCNGLALLHLLIPTQSIQNFLSFFNTYGLFNRYGLFADMTIGRHEIIVEGSYDKETWQEYEFPNKPHKLDQHPLQIAPLQPRVEWQLWFISTTSWSRVGWFRILMERLLEGKPFILALFKENPFPDKPPKYVRALLYAYKFNDIKTWKKSGNYWNRTLIGVYCPILEIDKN